MSRRFRSQTASFDTVVAAWMLYHVPDLDRGLAEIARVLTPGGRLVAVTNSELHLEEARAHAGVTMVGRLSVQPRQRREILRAALRDRRADRRRRLGHVPGRRGDPRYVRSMITDRRGSERRRVPDDVGPVRAGVAGHRVRRAARMSGTDAARWALC